MFLYSVCRHLFATAENDISLDSDHITLPQVVSEDDLQVTVEITLFLDEIAQEANETFTLCLDFQAGTFGDDPIIRDTMTGTIIDATGKVI